MLRDEIKLKLNECLKDQDKKSISTLRLVLAAVKDRDIAARSNGNNSGISDDEIKLLLQTMNIILDILMILQLLLQMPIDSYA